MAFFNIIIPSYNCEKTLKRAVDSVKKQTFKDYTLTIVDDCSTDNTREVIRDIDEVDVIMLTEKRFNGGTRNVGVYDSVKGEYIIFLDCDDEFVSDDFLEKLHNLIVNENYPDMVRLPYEVYYDDTIDDIKAGTTLLKVVQITKEKSVADVACSSKVAPWTKAVKAELFRPFPENTLMEDVAQHLAQCDVTETVAWFSEPVVKWHINKKSTSHNESPKWQSSAWRFIADLMDLELKKQYTRERRDYKLRKAKENLLNGKASQ